MIHRTRVMLYVADVEKSAQFWRENLLAEEVTKTPLPEGFVNIVLRINETTEVSLFAKDFIEKYSPEVLHHVPSLMFFSDQFEALHQKIVGATEIVDNNGELTFAFPDLDGHYFVIAKNK